MASVYYEGMFQTKKIVLPVKILHGSDVPSESNFQKKLKEFISGSDIVCDEIQVKNQMYRKKELLVVGVVDRFTLEVGIIAAIVLKNEEVYFACKVFQAVRNDLEYFSSGLVLAEVRFVHADSLIDYKPLKIRGSLLKFVFSLHHHISFSFD